MNRAILWVLFMITVAILLDIPSLFLFSLVFIAMLLGGIVGFWMSLFRSPM